MDGPPATEDAAAFDAAAAEAKGCALRLLARREHSQLELRRKLASRGHAESATAAALATLAASDLQSEERFAQGYARMALDRGHGEHRIQAALRERGIEPALAASALELDAEGWRDRAAAALRKRFGDAPAGSAAAWAKRARFLAGRGFGTATVAAAVGDCPLREGT